MGTPSRPGGTSKRNGEEVSNGRGTRGSTRRLAKGSHLQASCEGVTPSGSRRGHTFGVLRRGHTFGPSLACGGREGVTPSASCEGVTPSAPLLACAIAAPLAKGSHLRSLLGLRHRGAMGRWRASAARWGHTFDPFFPASAARWGHTFDPFFPVTPPIPSSLAPTRRDGASEGVTPSARCRSPSSLPLFCGRSHRPHAIATRPIHAR